MSDRGPGIRKKDQRVRTIYWNDTEVYIVRGHVSVEEFAALTDEPPQPVVHLWGRWTPCVGEYDRRLGMCDGPGRGVFPFTVQEGNCD